MNRLTLALVAALGTSAAFAMEKPYVGVDYQLQYHDFGGSSDGRSSNRCGRFNRQHRCG